ncbi:WD40-repeat-containing domain protein [Lanmaoa asiatica]|nr:WD40-repeat-containing domain protein [Lanmaoa asiatica]
MVLDAGADSGTVWAVAFQPNGRHILGGSRDGLRRWRLEDGKEVGKQTGMNLNAVAVSRDHKWIMCGTTRGTSVWDSEMHEKAIAVDGTSAAYAIDVAPDSKRFATGTQSNEASIWSIPSGERLVGPLKHNESVTGIKFSPNGEHIAIARDESIGIFDSRNGDQLINIKIPRMPSVGLEQPGERDSARQSEVQGDPLEVEVPSSTAAPEFDFDEPPSPASSAHPCDDEAPPLGTSHAIPRSSDMPPITSPPAPPDENLDTAKSSKGNPVLKRLLQFRVKKSNKDPASHNSARPSGKSRQPADHSRSQSPARVVATNEGPSWMAAVCLTYYLSERLQKPSPS